MIIVVRILLFSECIFGRQNIAPREKIVAPCDKVTRWRPVTKQPAKGNRPGIHFHIQIMDQGYELGTLVTELGWC